MVEQNKPQERSLQTFQKISNCVWRFVLFILLCASWLVVGIPFCAALLVLAFVLALRDFMLPALTNQNPHFDQSRIEYPIELFFRTFERAWCIFRSSPLPEMPEPRPFRLFLDGLWAVFMWSALLAVFWPKTIIRSYGTLSNHIAFLLRESHAQFIFILIGISMAVLFGFLGYLIGAWMGYHRKKKERLVWLKNIDRYKKFIASSESRLRVLDAEIKRGETKRDELKSQCESAEQQLKVLSETLRTWKDELAKTEAALKEKLGETRRADDSGN